MIQRATWYVIYCKCNGHWTVNAHLLPPLVKVGCKLYCLIGTRFEQIILNKIAGFYWFHQTCNFMDKVSNASDRQNSNRHDMKINCNDRVLGNLIKSGVVSVPVGIQSSLESSGQTDQILPADSAIKVIEGAKNNLPDELAMEATKQISNLASTLTENDILIVLVHHINVT